MIPPDVPWALLIIIAVIWSVVAGYLLFRYVL